MSLASLQFNEHGYLVPGFHDIGLEKFKELFVDSFPNSEPRVKIYNGYCDFCSDFRELEEYTSCHWLNGSFSSSKENPNDIDMFIILNGDKIDNSPSEEREQINQVIERIKGFRSELKEKYCCDVMFCNGNSSHEMMAYRGYFTFDRENKPKGVLKRVDLEGGDYNE